MDTVLKQRCRDRGAIRRGCYGNREFTFNGSTTKKTMTLFFSLSLADRAGLTFAGPAGGLPRASAVQSKIKCQRVPGSGRAVPIIRASSSRSPSPGAGAGQESCLPGRLLEARPAEALVLTTDLWEPLPRPPRDCGRRSALRPPRCPAPASLRPGTSIQCAWGKAGTQPPGTSIQCVRVKAGTPHPGHLHAHVHG